MRHLCRISVLVVSVLFVLAGCGEKNTHSYQGPKYPATTRIIPVFVPDQVPVNCKVFSQGFAWLPANSSGKTIAQAVEKEAQDRGADMLLIGKSRQATENMGPAFTYYGPVREYNCRDKWPGWKFGYETWAEQGDWITLGYKEWNNADVTYDVPLILQAAFLHCQQ